MTAIGSAGASVNRPFDPGIANAGRVGCVFDHNPLRPDDVKSTLTPVQQGEALREAAKTKDTPSTATDFAIPKTPANAPSQIRFSPDVQKVFDAQWNASFPGGKSLEQGATLTFEKKTNTVGVQNVGGLGSTSGSFSPDTTLKDPKKDALLGVFHTHPYDKTEGGHTGVSLSGGDAAYMINGKQNVIVAQSGTQQFMFMRTAKTPASVDFAKVDAANNKRIGDLMAKGDDFATASRTAARETAVKYNLAYYEGANGVLNRISPK
jgi:type VI secretion system secreted protein VgrG